MLAALVTALVTAFLGGCVAGDAGLAASPQAVHASADRALGDQLAAHLRTLPGVTAASAMVRHGFRDPFGRAGADPAPAVAQIIVTTAPGADAVAVSAAVSQVVAAAIPDVRDPDIVVVPAIVPPPALARVGPFEVTTGSRRPLQLALIGALVVIAGLAGWIALLSLRRGR